jgi:hypothetical protein
MFHLEPISTANVISIVQVIAVMVGFFFSWQSLNAARQSIGVATQSLDATHKNIALATASLNATRENIGLATKNAQVQLYNNMLIQGRDLQLKFLDDMVSENEKVKTFQGIVIAYYASCFELRSILDLPENAKKLLDSDIKESMRQKSFRDRFEELRHLHSQKFGEYVNSLKGV